jgi:chemotaxis methyl-accepting protein methylase
MILDAPAVRAGAVRRALRAAYGLGLDGLSDEQVLGAAAPLGPGHPALAQSGALARVVDALPIAESWMFRDESLWRWLQEELLPALVVDGLSTGRQVRALSLGCATGQEAHSLAILLLGLLEAAGFPISGAPTRASVLGLDVSPERVVQAAAGLASSWSVTRCPPRWLGGRVRQVDAATGRWQVDQAVRALCRFELGNLLEVARPGSQALRGVDLVLCRHVLIYFRPAEAAEVVAGLVRALDPGATLVLAPAEAHLATGLPGLEPLPEVGAFCRVAVEARLPPPRRPSTPDRFRSRPSRLSAAPLLLEEAPARHALAALEHTAAGRSAEALREARAACFHDPRQLLSRLVLGRELLATDQPRGRAVLAELVELTSALPAESSVPHAPGLSVGQLTAAAILLMRRGSDG